MQALSFGMDVVILSMSSPHEEYFWQKRLDTMRGQVIKEKARVITICENWEGGAGNALGTLYAFSKARSKLKAHDQIDLLERLEMGDSIGLYHTAGKGTRLAPLTGCEYNSKSRIKLLGTLFDKTQKTPITLLEASLKQTSIFAPKRKGRLSVFWGDQLFIPENEIAETQAHVDLLVKLLPKIPGDNDWVEQGYHKYGLVLAHPKHNFKQLEKLTFESFSKLSILPEEQIGISFGSFSLSKQMLEALLIEFEAELKEKKIKLDTDPHLWMPLSLDEETYLNTLRNKSISEDFLKTHYKRIQNFKEEFLSTPLLRCTDLGEKTLWWDYGNTASYLANSLKLNENTEEGKAMRIFFNTPTSPENQINTTQLKIENSILIDCKIEKGSIKNSVLLNVTASEVDIENSALIETSAQKVDSKSSILYNVAENGPVYLRDHTVRSDIFSEKNGHIKFQNSILTPIPWEQCANENPFSFAKLHQFIQGLHPSEGQHCAQTAHNKVKQAVINLQNSQ